MITTYEELIKHVKERTYQNHVMLSFSLGKDAWGTWLAIRDHFEVHPFYMYIVPHLEFIDEYIAYCEKKLGCHIYQYPHTCIYEYLDGLADQTPQRIWLLMHMDFKKITKDDVNEVAIEDAGLPKDSTYIALGTRASDSIMRRTHFQVHGPVNDKRKVFSPIWNWNKAKLVDELKKNDIKLSKEYLWFGRSLDAPVLLYAYNLKRYAPRDYDKFLDWYPLMDEQVWRYERILQKEDKNVH